MGLSHIATSVGMCLASSFPRVAPENRLRQPTQASKLHRFSLSTTVLAVNLLDRFLSVYAVKVRGAPERAGARGSAISGRCRPLSPD